MIQLLDGPQAGEGGDVRVLPLRTAQLASMQKAAEAIQTATNAPPVDQKTATMLAQQRQQATPPVVATPPQAPTAPGPALKSPNAPAGAEHPGTEARPRPGLANPVTVEMLEGIDMIVVRGNPQDVNQVIKIIEEMERIARDGTGDQDSAA